MGLLNYTTKIDPDKTAAEIARCLSTHGASAIMTDYKDGRASKPSQYACGGYPAISLGRR
jgi:hypothetical protein